MLIRLRVDDNKRKTAKNDSKNDSKIRFQNESLDFGIQLLDVNLDTKIKLLKRRPTKTSSKKSTHTARYREKDEVGIK